MADEYAQRISTVVVGQIAETCGYEKAHKNALGAVADVMMRFVQELGMYAKEVAEHQGRTDVNALDMVRICAFPAKSTQRSRMRATYVLSNGAHVWQSAGCHI